MLKHNRTWFIKKAKTKTEKSYKQNRRPRRAEFSRLVRRVMSFSLVCPCPKTGQIYIHFKYKIKTQQKSIAFSIYLTFENIHVFSTFVSIYNKFAHRLFSIYIFTYAHTQTNINIIISQIHCVHERDKTIMNPVKHFFWYTHTHKGIFYIWNVIAPN